MNQPTMTMWGAFQKLEAISAYAYRAGYAGRIEISAEIEGILMQSSWTRESLTERIGEMRTTVGKYPARTANWLDSALFNLMLYMGGKEIQLTGAELLDQLIDAVPSA